MSSTANTRVQRVMIQPINLVFRFLQHHSRVQIWLYANTRMRLEGYLVGFDEYMNLVLDAAEEVYLNTHQRRRLGRILLKGGNVCLIQNVSPQPMKQQKPQQKQKESTKK